MTALPFLNLPDEIIFAVSAHLPPNDSKGIMESLEILGIHSIWTDFWLRELKTTGVRIITQEAAIQTLDGIATTGPDRASALTIRSEYRGDIQSSCTLAVSDIPTFFRLAIHLDLDPLFITGFPMFLGYIPDPHRYGLRWEHCPINPSAHQLHRTADQIACRHHDHRIQKRASERGQTSFASERNRSISAWTAIHKFDQWERRNEGKRWRRR